MRGYSALYQPTGADQELGADLGGGPRQFALALLITNWMRGFPLARLIANRIIYLKRKNRECKLPKEIRDVMHDVEQVARFKPPSTWPATPTWSPCTSSNRVVTRSQSCPTSA